MGLPCIRNRAGQALGKRHFKVQRQPMGWRHSFRPVDNHHRSHYKFIPTQLFQTLTDFQDVVTKANADDLVYGYF